MSAPQETLQSIICWFRMISLVSRCLLLWHRSSGRIFCWSSVARTTGLRSGCQRRSSMLCLKESRRNCLSMRVLDTEVVSFLSLWIGEDGLMKRWDFKVVNMRNAPDGALFILSFVLFWEFYSKTIFKFIKVIFVVLPSYTLRT